MKPLEYLMLGASVIGSGFCAYALRRWGGIDFGALAGIGGTRATPRLGRDVSGLPASIWFVCAAMVYLALPVGAALGAGLPSGWVGSRDSAGFAVAGGVCAFGAGAAVALLTLYLIGPRVGPGAGTRWSWSDVPLGLLGAVCVAPFYAFATIAAQWFAQDVLGREVPRLAHSSLERFVGEPFGPIGLGIVFTAVVLVPVVEECVYRVFLTACLIRLLSGRSGKARPGARTVGLAVLAAGVLFACAHAAGQGPVPWVAVPGLFVLALGLGLAYERTRRLGVPIVMHAAFNLANLALALVVDRS